MKYIGPFLKLNSLNEKNIKNQLFYLAKESIKQIVLNSELGIKYSSKKIKNKNYSHNDISIFNSNSPLLCIYKKGSSVLKLEDHKLKWTNDKIKKEINISSNAYLTLCLLELSRYFEPLEKMYPKKYNFSSFYTVLSKNQLEFYAANFRNFEGVFVNKKHISETTSTKLEFEEKSSDFKFSDQALIMAAFYSCSEFCSEEDKEIFKNFSFDILNMFKEYKESLYNLSTSELAKICLGFNIFYNYNQNSEVLALLLDLCDFTKAKYIDSETEEVTMKKNISTIGLLCLNYILLYKNTKLLIYEENIKEIYSKLQKLYSQDLGMFIKNTDKKEISYTSEEIIIYLICSILYNDIFDSVNSNIIVNIFKHQVLESGIISSWPDVPSLDNPERYNNFSLVSEDLLPEQDFKFPSIPTPEASKVASVFFKTVTYNKKKNTFENTKDTFYTEENMYLFFLLSYLFKPNYRKYMDENQSYVNTSEQPPIEKIINVVETEV